MQKTFLNVGSGPPENAFVPLWLLTTDWKHVRLDIEPANQPDILCSATDMRAHVEDATFDAIWAANIIEHLYVHEVDAALREFARVVKPDGIVHVIVPDLQRICERIVQGKLMEPAYVSRAGPIAAIDMLYGHREALANGFLHMAHKTGFNRESLTHAIRAAGLRHCRIAMLDDWDLLAVASMSELKDHPLMAEMNRHAMTIGSQ